MDGCSSSCQVEANFNCDSASPSVCQLMNMTISVVALKKMEGKNEVVLSLDLSPTGVAFYEDVDWAKAFDKFSHDLSVI